MTRGKGRARCPNGARRRGWGPRRRLGRAMKEKQGFKHRLKEGHPGTGGRALAGGSGPRSSPPRLPPPSPPACLLPLSPLPRILAARASSQNPLPACPSPGPRSAAPAHQLLPRAFALLFPAQNVPPQTSPWPALSPPACLLICRLNASHLPVAPAWRSRPSPASIHGFCSLVLVAKAPLPSSRFL